MDQKELISVILPVYNKKEYVARAIDSILNQSYPSWELIIVDDGSTDGSEIICAEYAGKYPDITLIREENSGVSHARNIGLSHAKGEWIAFLDADDAYTPRALEKMIDYSGNADLVMGAWISLPQYYVFGIKNPEVTEVTKNSENIVDYLKVEYFNTVWGKLFRREKCKARFDESIRSSEDTRFMTDSFSYIDVIRVVPYIVYYYYEDTTNSLNRSININRFYVAKQDWKMYYRLFPMKEARIYSDRKLIFFIVYNIWRMILYMHEMTVVEKQIILMMLQEDLFTPDVKIIPTAGLDANMLRLWNTILTRPAEEVIAEFERMNAEREKKPSDSIQKAGESEIPEDPTSSFLIKIAGITVEVKHRYDLIREKCKGYLAANGCEPEISMSATAKRIAFSVDWTLKHSGDRISNEAAEYDAVPYDLYGRLPQFGACWLHSVVVARNGCGYAFTAQPETGKSTHGKLWLKAFPDAEIINGDNAIIRRQPDGTFYAYGTPFCGKEGYNVNTGVPLKGICFLKRGKKNTIRPVDPDFAVTALYQDNFCITPASGKAHMDLYQQLTEKVPCYVLECNMDVEAAQVAWQGMNDKDER